MKIYRIENERGLGPLAKGYHPCLATSDERQRLRRLPTPQSEWLVMMSGEHVCGCSSMDQLHKWFNSLQIDEMEKDGYHLKEFEVPDELVQVGKYQVVFKKPREEVKDERKV